MAYMLHFEIPRMGTEEISSVEGETMEELAENLVSHLGYLADDCAFELEPGEPIDEALRNIRLLEIRDCDHRDRDLVLRRAQMMLGSD